MIDMILYTANASNEKRLVPRSQMVHKTVDNDNNSFAAPFPFVHSALSLPFIQYAVKQLDRAKQPEGNDEDALITAANTSKLPCRICRQRELRRLLVLPL